MFGNETEIALGAWEGSVAWLGVVLRGDVHLWVDALGQPSLGQSHPLGSRARLASCSISLVM